VCGMLQKFGKYIAGLRELKRLEGLDREHVP
jgi:hypothetical protein